MNKKVFIYILSIALLLFVGHTASNSTYTLEKSITLSISNLENEQYVPSDEQHPDPD
jgi:hypothetical protein